MDTTISTTTIDMYINIVYIDNDLAGGRHPVVGETYELVLADTINTKYPIRRVQLQKDGRPSGWVREVDKGTVKAILYRGGLCSCVVTSKRDFIWDDDTCCWGTALLSFNIQ
ncbi:hypothetical protein DFP73DRAFT_599718 [Morchella snyderi]|nr:hypothetical protein DFP73DRAFT_599718 [Morchella snyderi]